MQARATFFCALLCLAGCQDGGNGRPRTLAESARATRPSADPAASSAAASASATTGATAEATARPGAPADDWIERHLRQADPRFAQWLSKAEELRLQILVTVVEGTDGGTPRFAEHGYRADAEYFYPASAIKTFLAVSALRTLDRLAKRHDTPVDARARLLRCREDRAGCEPPEADEKKGAAEDDDKEHEKMWVGQEIHKLLSYSDNDSYDRLYDIVGLQELNEDMAALGFSSVRFHHRMNAPASRSKLLRRVVLVPPGGKAITIPLRKSEFEPPSTPATRLTIGTAHFGDRGRVDEPMDFSTKNYASLRDMQRLNVALLLPDSKGAVDLGLSDEQRELLVKAMTGRLHPVREATRHKPLLPGVLEVLPEKRVRYVGKSGRAYGFHLENAFIADKSSGRGMFVTATVYANPNGVLNDDNYDYDDTTRPLLRALGEALARAVFGQS